MLQAASATRSLSSLGEREIGYGAAILPERRVSDPEREKEKPIHTHSHFIAHAGQKAHECASPSQTEKPHSESNDDDGIEREREREREREIERLPASLCCLLKR